MDLSKLNSFSTDVYNKIISIHPEWKSYAVHDEELPEFVAIYIPSPVSNKLCVDICTMEGEEEEITVHFGPPHIHLFMYKPFKIKTLDDQIKALEEIIQKILSEEIILAEKKSWFFGNPTLGWISPTKYKILLEENKLNNAVSWNGTFAYPANEKNLDWIPERFPAE
ncbi:MAG: hypothetical protein DRQ13_00270 [Ignavibacteriae bacterium]|nr:MAG: hypothetical protein DRQ13_00270 [Ignavibacteriota bacterium]